ncbi:hypothetical protein QF028_000249 [Neobacillus sp. B4I6]
MMDVHIVRGNVKVDKISAQLVEGEQIAPLF